MPKMPAISTIIVFPYHIQNWMKATTERAFHFMRVKFFGPEIQPKECKISFTGPIGYPNSTLNKMAIDAAVMMFGI